MNLNKVQLIGRLGKDPELKDTKGGYKAAKFSMATSKSRKNENGEQVKKTLWFQITAWNKLALNCHTYLKKGSLVYVEGEIDYDEYEQNGVKHLSMTVSAQTVIFLDTKEKESQILETRNNDDIPF